MADKKYTVYAHINKTNKKIYIGITFNSVAVRWKNGYGYKGCPLFYRAIQKYGWDNFEHKILFENLTQKEAEKIEVELIQKYQSNDKRFGYNIENGGRHNIVTEETKQKISLAHKGKKLSEETKKKISQVQLGRKLSEETKKKISQANKGKNAGEKNGMFGKPSWTRGKYGALNPVYGRHHTEEEKLKVALSNPKRKPIICIETQEKFISINDAAKKIGILRECIRDVCNGKRKSTHNLHFKYIEKGGEDD